MQQNNIEEEEDQLPLARMIAINRPSFWIFFGVCCVLFICEWVLNHQAILVNNEITISQVTLLFVTLVGLLLNIIAVFLKDKPIEQNFMICTWFFEIAGVIAAAFLIFLPL